MHKFCPPAPSLLPSSPLSLLPDVALESSPYLHFVRIIGRFLFVERTARMDRYMDIRGISGKFRFKIWLVVQIERDGKTILKPRCARFIFTRNYYISCFSFSIVHLVYQHNFVNSVQNTYNIHFYLLTWEYFFFFFFKKKLRSNQWLWITIFLCRNFFLLTRLLTRKNNIFRKKLEKDYRLK